MILRHRRDNNAKPMGVLQILDQFGSLAHLTKTGGVYPDPAPLPAWLCGAAQTFCKPILGYPLTDMQPQCAVMHKRRKCAAKGQPQAHK